MSNITTFGILLVVIAVGYQYYYLKSEWVADHILKVSTAWDRILSNSTQWPRKVVLGYVLKSYHVYECTCYLSHVASVNANLDLIVSATSLLRVLNETPGVGVDHSVLNSTRALQELVSYSMQECAGTERYFSNKTLFDHIVHMAQSIPHTVSKRLSFNFPLPS